VKVELLSVYRRFPHQTGVTERSISYHDGLATDDVLNHMVIGHLTNRIGY
jgi:hypothetical protein